jgi:hypothetical protein
MLITVTLAVLGSLALLAVVNNRIVDLRSRDQLHIEVAKALLNLLLVGIGFMLVKAIVERYVAARERERLESAQREVDARLNAERAEAAARAAHALRLKALTTLTSSYWNTKKALKIIEAHRSAKSYGEQIRVVIDHRLELQQLDNEISAGMYALDNAHEIGRALSEIDEQLGRVTDEWRDKYLMLSQLQKEDEETLKPQDKKVPGEIERLPQFRAVRANGFAALHDPFERAANLIRPQVFTVSARPATIQMKGLTQPDVAERQR